MGIFIVLKAYTRFKKINDIRFCLRKINKKSKLNPEESVPSYIKLHYFL